MLRFFDIIFSTIAILNELPQILNIFAGQMSVVGYRPFAKTHYDLYSDEVKKYINTICPGLTGIGSIIFRNEEEMLHSVHDREYFHDKIITPYKGQLECWYVQHKNIKNYFLIIFCTILVALNTRNNLWRKLFKDLPEMPAELTGYLA
jgi:lipopolysaccharide/colanic/teichoic acid biosynthesis glycosyltransferase